mgnify:CR=1 FL=1
MTVTIERDGGVAVVTVDNPPVNALGQALRQGLWDAAEALDADVAGLGYEEARDELSAIVARLESGQVGLEESMRLWTRGEALAARCTVWLDRAQASLDGTPEPAGE